MDNSTGLSISRADVCVFPFDQNGPSFLRPLIFLLSLPLLMHFDVNGLDCSVNGTTTKIQSSSDHYYLFFCDSKFKEVVVVVFFL